MKTRPVVSSRVFPNRCALSFGPEELHNIFVFSSSIGMRNKSRGFRASPSAAAARARREAETATERGEAAAQAGAASPELTVFYS